ncbi:MAG: ribosomal RNA small subunit methyltransferase A [Clostridia bacterium]|nr:ribosomal RNA small subunit methyltransferase A [Clostridia bacterium]
MRRKGKGRQRTEEGFHAKHELGQNFILDEQLTEELVTCAGVNPGDGVIEIGPGMGTMTKQLAAITEHVTAIEVDESLRPFLTVALEHTKAKVIYADVLSLDLKEIAQAMPEGIPIRVVANIPYYITGEILEKVMRELPDAVSMSFMIQKEVAEKMMAEPGKEGYGPLAIKCQMRYMVTKALDVPAERFTPRPHVDSAFIRMDKRPELLYPVRDLHFFENMVSRVFLLRRKTLVNNLISQYALGREACIALLQEAGISEQARAEALSLQQMAELCNHLWERVNGK